MHWFTIGIVVCVLISWWAGYKTGFDSGRDSREIDLSGLGAKEAFAYFLQHEIERHRDDIGHAKADLKKLTDSGIRVPNIPTGLWIKVK